MSEPFVAEIRMFGFTFAPRGWAQCNGQLMPISQNTALFSLLGTMYGGNGQTTFGLPNLQGAVPVGWGQGPGRSDRQIGETGGETEVTLTPSQMPAHNHTVAANSISGGSNSPAGRVFGVSQARAKSTGYVSGGTPTVNFSDQAVGSAGGSQPHNNMPPYLCTIFCIALQGIYPSRS